MAVVGAAEIVIVPDFSRFDAQLKAGVARSSGIASSEVGKATKEIEKVAGATAGAVGKTAESAVKSVEHAAVGAGSGIGNAFGFIKTNAVKKLEGLAEEGSGLLSKLGLSGVNAGALMGGGIAAGVAVAALAFVGFAAKGVEEFSKLTQEVTGFQRVTGASAEESSKLVAAARVLGVSAEALSRSMVLLSKNVVSGKVDLHAFGVEVAHTATGNVDVFNTFLNLADAIKKLGPGAESSRLAVTALGRGGAQLLPILLRGREGLQELFAAAAQHHQIFTDEDEQKGKEFRLAIKNLQETFVGLEVEVGQKVIPGVIKLVGAITAVVEIIDKVANAAGPAFGFVNDAIQKIPGPLRHVLSLLNPIVGLFDIFGSKAKDSANSLTEQAAAASAAAEALDKTAAATTASIDSMIAADSAQTAFTHSITELAKATKDLNDLQTVTPADLKKIEAATRGVERATHSLEEAQRARLRTIRELADASADLARLESTEAARSAQAVERAHIGQARAARGLTEANETLAAAEAHLIKVRAGTDEESLRKLADAEKRLADARQAAVDAARQLSDANNVLAKAQQDFDEAAAAGDVNAEARAFARLEAAHKQQADAQAAAAAADTAAAKAQADQQAAASQAGPNNTDAVVQAQQAVEDATLGVRDAQLGVADATTAAAEAERQQAVGSDALISARQKVADLSDRIVQANQAIADQQEALAVAQANETQARKDATGTADELAAAIDRVNGAKAGEISSAISLAKALTEQEVKALEAATGHSVTAAEKAAIFADNLGLIAGQMDSVLAPALGRYKDLLVSLPEKKDTFIGLHADATFPIKGAEGITFGDLLGSLGDTLSSVGGAVISHLFGFAAGGPVTAGMPIIVGEKGPEVFVPNTNGVILPNGFSSTTPTTPTGGGLALNDPRVPLLLEQLLVEARLQSAQQAIIGSRAQQGVLTPVSSGAAIREQAATLNWIEARA